MKRIGVITLYDEGDLEGQAILAAFRAAMDKLGWVAGRNIAIDYVWASNVSNRLATLAAELVKSNPDVIVANGTPLTQATRQATQTTPIVFVEASDPLAERSRRKSGAAGWQRHGVFELRILDRSKMAGAAEGNRAQC